MRTPTYGFGSDVPTMARLDPAFAAGGSCCGSVPIADPETLDQRQRYHPDPAHAPVATATFWHKRLIPED